MFETTIAQLRSEVADLKAKLAGAAAAQELAVKSKEMDVRIEMKDTISAAYDKGVQHCKDTFKAMKELMN